MDYTNSETRTIARWSGEAAKEWWTRLDDNGRAQIEKMEARQVFILGWLACRASDANGVPPCNDDPDGDDGSGFGS